MAAEVLKYCPGDAVFKVGAGAVFLVCRGDTVWVDTDPSTGEPLFSGFFHRAKMIVGLPRPYQPDAKCPISRFMPGSQTSAANPEP